MANASVILSVLLLPQAKKLVEGVVQSYLSSQSTGWVRRQLVRIASRRIKTRAIARLEGFLNAEMSKEEADLFVHEFEAIIGGVNLTGAMLAEHDFSAEAVVAEMWSIRPPDIEVFHRRLDSRLKTVLGATVETLTQLIPELQQWERVAWGRLFAKLKELRQGQKDQLALLNQIHAIVRLLHADTEKYPPPKPVIAAPSPYLIRRVSARRHELGSMHGFLEKGEDLLTVLAAHKRIVLLADAGMGKSWELRRIAHAMAESSNPHYPLWDPEFKSYNPSDSLAARIDRSWPFWDAISDARRVLILDGLDEVGQDNVEATITRFKEFCDAQPESAVLVSCRAKVFTPFADYLSGFSAFFLRHLDGKSIELYVRDAMGDRWDDFSEQASALKLWDLLHVPFYLALATEVYQQKGSLPARRAAFFSELIESRIAKDAGRSVDAGVLRLRQKQVMDALSQLALGMEMLCTNEITDDAFVRLVPNRESRDVLNMSGIWNSVARNGGVYWRFEHNSIQEALAGRLLSTLDFDKIKYCVGVPPDRSNVNPSFGNAASFMLEEAANADVLQWFVEAAPEIAIQSESTLMPIEQRVSLVKAILADHERRGATVVWGKFSTHDMARFADTPELLAWLLDEAERAEDLRHFASLIRVAQHVTVPADMVDRAKGFYLSLFRDSERPLWLRRGAVTALSLSGLGDKSVVGEIVKEAQANGDSELLAEAYRLIRTSKCVDDFIDELLAGIDAALGQGRLLNERTEIREALAETTSEATLVRICDHFAEKPDRLNEIFLSHDFGDFVSSAVGMYRKEPSEGIFRGVIRLFSSLSRHYHHEFIPSVAQFFIELDMRQAAIDALLALEEKDELCVGEAVVALATRAELQVLVGRYQQGDLDKTILDGILHRMAPGELLDWLRNRLETVDPEAFRQEPRPQCSILTPQQDFDLLFDQEEYVRQVEFVFEQAGTDMLDWDTIHDLRWRPRNDVTVSGMVADDISHQAARNPVNRGAFIEEACRHWRTWSVGTAARVIAETEGINLTATQREVFEKWIKDSIPQTRFAGEKNDSGGTNYQVRARLIVCVAVLLDLPLSKEECGQFLQFPFDALPERVRKQVVAYLSRRIGKAELRSQIVRVIETRSADESVLAERYRYCAEAKMNEVKPPAIRDLVDEGLPHNVRLAALRALEALPDGQDAIIPLLPGMQEDLRLIALDSLSRTRNQHATDYLEKLFHDGEGEIRDQAAHLLVRYENQDALRFYVERVIEQGRLPYEDRIDRSSVFTALVATDSVAPLLDLLRAHYEDRIQSKDPTLDIDGIVRGALTRIAQQSDEAYTVVRGAVEAFLAENRALWSTGFLHAFLDDLDRQHWMAKSKRRPLEEVVEFLQRISAG